MIYLKGRTIHEGLLENTHPSKRIVVVPDDNDRPVPCLTQGGATLPLRTLLMLKGYCDHNQNPLPQWKHQVHAAENGRATGMSSYNTTENIAITERYDKREIHFTLCAPFGSAKRPLEFLQLYEIHDN